MSSREFQVEREEHANTVFHESPCAMSQPQESPRSSRSNSLKPQSQIFLFPSRPKRRTLSLPSKPIIPPHIIIQGCHNNNDTQSEEEEKERSEVKKENMAWYTPLVGLSCSLVVYFLACALTYYSSRWQFFLYVPGHQTKRAADKKKHSALQCNHTCQRLSFLIYSVISSSPNQAWVPKNYYGAFSVTWSANRDVFLNKT